MYFILIHITHAQKELYMKLCETWMDLSKIKNLKKKNWFHPDQLTLTPKKEISHKEINWPWTSPPKIDEKNNNNNNKSERKIFGERASFRFVEFVKKKINVSQILGPRLVRRVTESDMQKGRIVPAFGLTLIEDCREKRARERERAIQRAVETPLGFRQMMHSGPGRFTNLKTK